MKTCKTCGETKPPEMFAARRLVCRICRNRADTDRAKRKDAAERGVEYVPPVYRPTASEKLAQSVRVPDKLATFSGDAIITERTRHTVGPSLGYDPRYQCPDHERVVGGFASMGIGRYL